MSAGVHGFDVMKKTVRCDMLKKILNYPSARVKVKQTIEYNLKKNIHIINHKRAEQPRFEISKTKT